MREKIRKMMNLIAITLITTQLAVAGLFSPNPHKNNNGGEQVIVKDGHRAVVVEYADTSGSGDGNTKVSISPPQPTKPGPIEDQLSRAAISVAGVAQDAKGKPSPGEVICDVYGKCKHVIAGGWSRAKDKAAEAEEDVKEVVEEAVDKAKDLASMATQKAEESTEGVRQNAKEKVREAGEAADKAKEKAGEMAEKMKQKGMKGKKEVSDIIKRGKEVVSGVIRYVFWPESVGSLMSMIHIIGFAMGYGISVWVTFIMSHVLAGVLSRQQFGMVQSKIYPVYFRSMVGSLGLALLGHLLGRRSIVFKNKADMLQAYSLMGSLLSVLANLLFLEPKATKAMFRRMKMEKEEGRGRDRVIETVVNDAADPISTTTTTTTASAAARSRQEEEEARSKMGKLNERLKKLNSYSSLLNIMTLMGLTWHLVYLSQRLSLNSC